MKIIPALRFPEFKNEGEWDKKTIAEVFNSFSGGTPSTSEREYYGGKIPFIRSAEINREETELFLTDEGLKNSSAKFVDKGDLLVALYGANSGDSAISKINGAINQAILCLQSDYSNTFTYNFLTLKKDWVISRFIQGGQGNLSGDIVKSIPIPFPKRKEQQKIASCLSSLDEVIAAHSQKLELLKDHKKGLMQNLFPQEGESVPKYRFKEFEKDGEWVEKKLGEITNYVDYRGKTPIKSEAGIFLVTAKNIKVGFIDYEISKEYIPVETYNSVMGRGKPKIGDVLITTEAPLGNVAVIDNEDIALAQRVIKFRGKESLIINSFLKHTFLSPDFQNKLENNSTGSTAKGIKGSILRQLIILYPSIQEQQKIASCLSSLDALITAQVEKIEQLQLHKKGLMQGLFPRMSEL